MKGIEVQLGNGKHLFAGFVPSRKTPAIGIRDGGTLTVLGYFIGAAEFETFVAEMTDAFGGDRFVLSVPAPSRAGES